MDIKKLRTELLSQERKYFDLSWYGKANPIDDESWDDVDEDIKNEAHKNMERIETEYANEIASLDANSYYGPDYAKGFNHGCLAAFRFVLMAISDDPEESGIEFAKSTFPDTHT